jgi:hypothetical protein
MDDDDIRAMNRRIELGWEPSRHQWQRVAERCKTMPEMRDLKVWGIKVGRRYERSQSNLNALVVETHEIVANPQFFHPTSMKASGLTYEEAEALIKLLES